MKSPTSTALRWGIVGTGTICKQISSDFALVPESEVVAVCSRSMTSADAFAERFDIANRFDDYDRMLASDIDAVYIGTPHVTHFDLARTALLAGCHVLCEKPLALNAAQVRELALIAQDSNRFLMEAMWMKFNPLYLKLGELIHVGLSAMCAVSARHSGYRSRAMTPAAGSAAEAPSSIKGSTP